MDQMSDSDQCSNRLQPDLISLLVNFSCALGHIMTRYDFLWARRVILRGGGGLGGGAPPGKLCLLQVL